MSRLNVQHLHHWARHQQVFIDVRSQGEFAQGHLPGAINAPILNDEERALVGKCYKDNGQEAAIRLGHEIVSGENKSQKLRLWKSILEKNPEAILMCFRGGQRSQITQRWLQESGIHRPLIEGGYKVCRQALLDHMKDECQKNRFLVISGPTGSAKTHFLKDISEFWPVLDLEHHARHRGSAFGKMDQSQPQQAVFENHLIFEMIRNNHLDLPFAVEDESRLIGKSAQPEPFFATLRSSPVLLLEVPIEKRTENTFYDYILQTDLAKPDVMDSQGLFIFAKYKKALMDIQKKLGGLRTQEMMKTLENSEKLWLQTRELESNKIWIQALLQDYYDPMYEGSFSKRNPEVIFKGTYDQVFGFLADVKSKKREAPVKRKATIA